MRIACPGCAAEYEVPLASLNPRRKVRCTQCGAEWVPDIDPPDAPPDAGAGDPMPPERPSAMDRLAAVPPPRPSTALRAAWVVTALVLAGSAAAALTWRGQVTRAWPESAWILGAAKRVPSSPAQDPHDDKPQKSAATGTSD